MLLSRALFFDKFIVSFVKVPPQFYGSYFGVQGKGLHILLGAFQPGLICSSLPKLTYISSQKLSSQDLGVIQ